MREREDQNRKIEESKTMKSEEARVSRTVQQSKVELEKHIENLVREREDQNRKIEESKTMKSEEARVSNLRLS